MRTRFLSIFVLGMLLVSANAFAQTSRTWVSYVGNDADPCSYTAPCKTFAGAYIKTATGGVISVKDRGGYGSLAIGKSITIDGTDGYGSVLHTGDGITINFTTTDSFSNTVVLRGLSFDSPSSAGYGVVVSGTTATHVHIENCKFTRAGAGVGMFPGGAGSSLRMTDVDIRKMNAYGVAVDGAAGAALKLTLRNVQTSQVGSYGLIVFDNTNGTVSESSFDSSGVGVAIEAANVHMNLVRTVLSENTTTGLRHTVSGITTLIDGCSVFGNGTGISNAGSTVIGFSNNSIGNNGTDVFGNAVTSVLRQ